MERFLHQVADLPRDARSAVEAIIGHPLSPGDVLYIAALKPGAVLPVCERQAAWDDLESIACEMQKHAAMSGLSADQIDALIDAEAYAVRHGRGE